MSAFRGPRLLRWFSSFDLARTALGALGIGYALIVGGSAQLSFAVTPVLVATSVALLLRFGSRSQNVGVSSGEKMAWVLAASLLPGPALAAVLSGPTIEVTSAGVSLLAAFGYLVVMGLLPMSQPTRASPRSSYERFHRR